MSLDWTKDVLEFHAKMSYKNGEDPGVLNKKNYDQRLDYMFEELSEFIEAKSLSNQADAMLDLIYFAIGTLLRMGIDPRFGWNEVHRANMDKTPADNHKHSIKPKGWVPPDPQILISRLNE